MTKDDDEKAGDYRWEETGLKKMPLTDRSGMMPEINFKGSQGESSHLC